MAGRAGKPRILKLLEDRNPGIKAVKGSRHWKICKNGRLLGIYPYAPRREGFAENTKSQLRAAGLKLGDRRKEGS